jgi:hypothetical protein
MLQTVESFGQINNGVNPLQLAEFTPPAPGITDTRVEGIGAATLGKVVEPFGVQQAVEAQDMVVGRANSTGGPTKPKAGGKYDDYATADE